MKILVIANYPRAGYEVAGSFNERSVKGLKELCDRVEVFSPSPYVPPFLSAVPRWRTWRVMRHELRDGVSVHRPAYFQLPVVASAFWVDRGAFFCCRRTARELHRLVGFDAIVSFGLIGAGGLAWRLAHDLGIPASGWATGGDLNRYAGTALGRVALRAIDRLDLVFYQSRDLLETAAKRLGMTAEMMEKNKHVVLARGIPEPPLLARTDTRHRIRFALGIKDEEVLVLNTGGIWRDKGVFELLEAMALTAAKDSRIRCVLIGSLPTFDDTYAVQRRLAEIPSLNRSVKILPACSPDKVWGYLCAADVFAFPSHDEGMPNSLLEAMVMGVPVVAFAIPPVREIEAGTGALVLVPPFDPARFSEAILRLAASPEERIPIGERGKFQVMDRFMVRKNMAEAYRLIQQMVRNTTCATVLGSRTVKISSADSHLAH